MPRITRKTALALAVSASLVLGAGALATAAVMKLPVFGFEPAAAEHPVAPRRTILRIIHRDHYVMKPAVQDPTPSANSGYAAAPSVVSSAPPPPRAAAPPVYATAAPSARAADPPPPPTNPAAMPVPSTAARPPAPAGCREPEWDSEQSVWHCSGGDD